jgi:hypothetical protein
MDRRGGRGGERGKFSCRFWSSEEALSGWSAMFGGREEGSYKEAPAVGAQPLPFVVLYLSTWIISSSSTTPTSVLRSFNL